MYTFLEHHNLFQAIENYVTPEQTSNTLKNSRSVKRINPGKLIRTRVRELNIYLLRRTKGSSSC